MELSLQEYLLREHFSLELHVVNLLSSSCLPSSAFEPPNPRTEYLLLARWCLRKSTRTRDHQGLPRWCACAWLSPRSCFLLVALFSPRRVRVELFRPLTLIPCAMGSALAWDGLERLRHDAHCSRFKCPDAAIRELRRKIQILRALKNFRDMSIQVTEHNILFWETLIRRIYRTSHSEHFCAVHIDWP